MLFPETCGSLEAKVNSLLTTTAKASAITSMRPPFWQSVHMIGTSVLCSIFPIVFIHGVVGKVYNKASR